MWKTQTSIYSLRAAPRAWHECLRLWLIEEGMEVCVSDPCLFKVEEQGNTRLLVVIYVDDLLFVGPREETDRFVTALKLRVAIKVSEQAQEYIGLELKRCDDGSLKLHQGRYIDQLLEKYGLTKGNPVRTPMETGITGKDLDGQALTVEEHLAHRSLLGALQYLASRTRRYLSCKACSGYARLNGNRY